MARVAHTPTQSPRTWIRLALVPKKSQADDWSIDREPMTGSGWHDSSWMLRKGLDVLEDVLPEPVPIEWRHKWHLPLALD